VNGKPVTSQIITFGGVAQRLEQRLHKARESNKPRKTRGFLHFGWSTCPSPDLPAVVNGCRDFAEKRPGLSLLRPANRTGLHRTSLQGASRKGHCRRAGPFLAFQHAAAQLPKMVLPPWEPILGSKRLRGQGRGSGRPVPADIAAAGQVDIRAVSRTRSGLLTLPGGAMAIPARRG
jgi:hypothetical protein